MLFRNIFLEKYMVGIKVPMGIFDFMGDAIDIQLTFDDDKNTWQNVIGYESEESSDTSTASSSHSSKELQPLFYEDSIISIQQDL